MPLSSTLYLTAKKMNAHVFCFKLRFFLIWKLIQSKETFGMLKDTVIEDKQMSFRIRLTEREKF